MAPAFKKPNSNCISPARKTAVKKTSNEPRETIAARTIAESPAAGPETLIWELEILPTRMPPIIPEMIPENNGAPEAIAIPRHKGSAIKNTTNPEEKSNRNVAKSLFFVIYNIKK